MKRIALDAILSHQPENRRIMMLNGAPCPENTPKAGKRPGQMEMIFWGTKGLFYRICRAIWVKGSKDTTTRNKGREKQGNGGKKTKN